ncbi:MAG: uroporphyrinogen decarboxylase [Gluconobacter potus]|uniref:Uroporphyrinogen decarboxylase n=1 Tax=Gluconobacter potus TaxID=2724927 RepID=A0ABR9YMJ4_9PROT|nr:MULTISPECIES: uroporphyrinogen decarboxylase [Gluconobacter]MBF0864906.1 uroporphyrinogen decarboxylase [Gluconobacter sp. R71656]MBF0868061.1 uroporphyrinogen decarboxylase [Gluconobacter sp. R75628]MBF0874043.1 uroporphyrinogen decarboxylase [Gluconobacter sp. R75629]MBF0883020.1 uroporphyrinogen decarboxylase [Gluconobacter potus]
MISENAPSSPSSKPLLRALRGEAIWPPPVWLMRQAGRYLPEFRAMRDRADFLTRCMTPDMATELTIQPIRRYGMDGAILFSDILILPWAMGQSLEFIDGRGPVLGAIRSEADLARLDPKRVQDAVAPVRETLSRLTKELPDVTTLLGFAGSPFTVSCYMVEGGGSRDFAETRRMMQTNPALFDRLIDTLTSSTAEMLCGQIEAGAEAVMLFDSWAGILPPSAFRRYVIEPTRQIVEYIRARHPKTPIIGFPRLGGIMVREYAQKTGVNTLALDTVADPVQISELVSEVRPGLTLQGNMDPMILFSGGETMIREAQAIRDAMRGKPHVFNLGHGVMQHTPPENVAALVEAVRSV